MRVIKKGLKYRATDTGPVRAHGELWQNQGSTGRNSDERHAAAVEVAAGIVGNASNARA